MHVVARAGAHEEAHAPVHGLGEDGVGEDGGDVLGRDVDVAEVPADGLHDAAGDVSRATKRTIGGISGASTSCSMFSVKEVSVRPG